MKEKDEEKQRKEGLQNFTLLGSQNTSAHHRTMFLAWELLRVPTLEVVLELTLTPAG